jgi:hypothetical protein
MKMHAMALPAGVLIGSVGVAAVEGLHAQGAKLKAYSVSENESSTVQPWPYNSLKLDS